MNVELKNMFTMRCLKHWCPLYFLRISTKEYILIWLLLFLMACVFVNDIVEGDGIGVDFDKQTLRNKSVISPIKIDNEQSATSDFSEVKINEHFDNKKGQPRFSIRLGEHLDNICKGIETSSEKKNDNQLPLRKSFKKFTKFAMNKMLENKHEPVDTCNFPFFNSEESRQIWELALRRQRLAAGCQRYEASTTDVTSSSWDDYMWDTKNHFGYCHISKTGSTSWMKHFLEWKGVRSGALDSEAVHERIHGKFPDLSQEMLKRELEEHNPLTFTTVRHPFTRLVSAFVDKIERNYMPQTRIKWVERVRWQSLEGLALDLREDILDKLPHLDESPLLNKLLVISRDPLEPIDFEVLAGTNETSSRMPFREFVRWVIRENFLCINDLTCLRNIDQHWRPQYVHCAPCANSYDIISKMETLKKDRNLIFKIIGKRFRKSGNNRVNLYMEYIRQKDINKIPKLHPELFLVMNSSSKPAEKDFRSGSAGDSLRALTAALMASLSREEIRLLTAAFTIDFTLFGYSPFIIV